MSSERRHELQENELAAYLGRLGKRVEPYYKLIAIVAGALLVAGLAMTFYNNSLAETRSDATLQLLQATGDAAVLDMVASEYPETPAAAWARLYQADRLMSTGMDALYQDREEALSSLEAGASAYQQAISIGSDRVLQSRANYGLARIAEAQGNADEAITAYEAVVSAAESDEMVEYANERIVSLNNPETREFLDWFGEQVFTPPEPSLPPSLDLSEVLSADPDFSLPEISEGLETEANGDASDNTIESADDAATTPIDTEETDQVLEPSEDSAETTEMELSVPDADDDTP